MVLEVIGERAAAVPSSRVTRKYVGDSAITEADLRVALFIQTRENVSVRARLFHHRATCPIVIVAADGETQFGRALPFRNHAEILHVGETKHVARLINRAVDVQPEIIRWSKRSALSCPL